MDQRKLFVTARVKAKTGPLAFYSTVHHRLAVLGKCAAVFSTMVPSAPTTNAEPSSAGIVGADGKLTHPAD